MDYNGSTEEKKARLFLANLGIDYDALTMEQFTNLIEVLKLSKHMNSPISQRGKGSIDDNYESGIPNFQQFFFPAPSNR